MFLPQLLCISSFILTLSSGFLSSHFSGGSDLKRVSLQKANMAPLTGIMSTLRAGAFRSSSSIAGALVASRLSMSTVVGNDAVAERQSIVHNKYDIMQEDFVKEYGALTTLYKHKKSGAEVLSVQIDDENKVFGITFRTPPEDDTGVPHILEHSVLCGSRKFPSKEPFVDLLKGSLQTFLNAFTYPDRTCYPVASQNTKDFYNLINVYLDAVLFPRAVNDPTVLQQEGWHFEAESPEAPLTYKGVVYNEMKGVYSSPDSLMARATQQALFPDNSYAVDSGGDPFAIPTLTFDYFKNFHARYYHPANSRVFFYGDDDPTARLDLLDEYLAEFDVPETPVQSKIEYQALKSEPWRITEKFPAGEENGDKHMIAVNWLMNDRPFTPKENLALTVLDHLLVGTSASTLRLAMDESGLGSSFIGGGIDDTLLQSTFSAGLKGVSPENVDKVEALVIDTLNKCAEEGFNAEAIEAAVNTIEFQLREFNTGAFPRGLSFMLGAMGSWIYDGNPTEEMHFEKPLQELKDDLAAGKPIFQDLLKTLLINNNHRLTVEMIPDTELEAKQIEQETSALEEIKKSMSESDVLKVIQDAETLKQLQAAEDSPEAKASLPKLSLEDLDKEGREIPIEVGEEAGIKVIKHAIPSNGILYTDVGVSLEGIDLEELVLLPLFSRLIRESGTSTMDRIALDESIGTHTGGIRSAFMVSQKYSAGGVVSNAKDVFGHLFFRGKSVANKSGKMFDLIHTMLTDAKLDNRQRVLEILRESKAQIEAGVITAGHQFAANRIDARYTTADYIQEITSGVSYVETLKQLLDQAENDWPTLQARLEKIKATLMKKDNILINLTGDDEVLEKTRASVSDFISKLPEDSATACAEWASAKLIVPENEGFVVPTQVNYVGLGGPLYKEGEKVDGSAEVVSRFLRTGYLWDNVRVMGGAYGGFCRFNPISGVFSFLSYRDPNLANTLSIYQNAGEYLASTDFDEATITQAIIGTIGDLDSPMGPDAKGFLSLRRYLNDQSAEDRQAKRDAILSTSAKDFKEFGERLKAFNADAKAAVITSAPALEKANEALPEKLAAKNVL